MNRNPQDLRPGGPGRSPNGANNAADQPWRWLIVLVLVIAVVLYLTHAFTRTNIRTLTYSQFSADATAKSISSATFNNENGV
ncbi:MAG: ATP-dependent metallopeptidase FtsH/Yme1/Tma family protein, partial [Acidimicrobiales bacterium]